MSYRYNGGGGAVPLGWSIDAALKFSRSQEAFEQQSEHIRTLSKEQSFEKIGKLVEDRSWPIQNQKIRGTCNAFAVVAAEEFIRFDPQQHVRPEKLSEEQLYSSMRAVAPDQSGINPDSYDANALAESGATFLSQAMHAIANHGICTEELLPYEKDEQEPNFFVAKLSDKVLDNAGKRKLKVNHFVHNIIKKAQPEDTHGPKKEWVTSLEGRNVSEFFLQKLKEGVPVVASFAMLDGSGYDAWSGTSAKWYGEVNYPADSVASGLKATAGHSVCILGFEPDQDKPGSGWFLFRNSVGRENFAWYFKKDPDRPVAYDQGYGYISIDEVDKYCWEYLFRKVAPNGGVIS